MSSFSATASTSGTALTSTKPSYTVTSSASATATSDVSQGDAQSVANTIAQQVATSVAQNDANIISQTLALSPSGVIGTYDHLNLSFALKVPINGQAEFTALIQQADVPGPQSEPAPPKALVITSSKTVYDQNYIQIPNFVQLSTLNSTGYNYGVGYGTQIVNGETFPGTTNPPQSVIENNRISTISIPRVIKNISYTYKIKIITSIRFYLNQPVRLLQQLMI